MSARELRKIKSDARKAKLSRSNMKELDRLLALAKYEEEVLKGKEHFDMKKAKKLFDEDDRQKQLYEDEMKALKKRADAKMEAIKKRKEEEYLMTTAPDDLRSRFFFINSMLNPTKRKRVPKGTLAKRKEQDDFLEEARRKMEEEALQEKLIMEKYNNIVKEFDDYQEMKRLEELKKRPFTKADEEEILNQYALIPTRTRKARVIVKKPRKTKKTKKSLDDMRKELKKKVADMFDDDGEESGVHSRGHARRALAEQIEDFKPYYEQWLSSNQLKLTEINDAISSIDELISKTKGKKKLGQLWSEHADLSQKKYEIEQSFKYANDFALTVFKGIYDKSIDVDDIKFALSDLKRTIKN